MGKLAKEFADIINKQSCFEPSELKTIMLAIRAINEWEKQNKGCFGCIHLGDKRYNCESCARFGHVDHYVSNCDKSFAN